MKDKIPSKKEIEHNIKLALDKIDSDGEQKVLDGLKTALENYLEDREFIIKLLKTLVSRTRDVKAENNHLASELRKWSAIFQRTGYFLRWRDRETLEWNEKRYSDEFLKYRKNIDRYFVGSDENDKMILNYPNGKVDRLPPYLFKNMKSKLSVEDAEQLYKEVIKQSKNLLSLIRRKFPDKIITPELILTCNFLMKNKEKTMTVKEIYKGIEITKQTAYNHLRFLEKKGWVSKLPRGLWSLNDLTDLD